jgi:hypothetical protein
MIRKTSLYLPLSFLTLFMLLTWPVWRWLWGEWWRNDYYSHGILIVPIALYLAWRRVDAHELEGDSWGLLLLLGSLAAYLFFLTDKAYFLAALAMIGLLGGLVWTFAGREVVGRWLFPLAFLSLMVPLPVGDVDGDLFGDDCGLLGVGAVDYGQCGGARQYESCDWGSV